MFKKCLSIISAYFPPSLCPNYFFDEIEKGMDFLSRKYENFIITRDFNCEVNESVISDFMDSYSLYNLIKGPTYFKSDNPRCKDLILTNRKHGSNPICFVQLGRRGLWCVWQCGYRCATSTCSNKEKYLRANDGPFMSKEMQKTNDASHQVFE